MEMNFTDFNLCFKVFRDKELNIYLFKLRLFINVKETIVLMIHGSPGNMI